MRAMIFPVLIGIVGVAILLSLGNWQVQRLEQKAAFLAEIRKMIRAEAVAMPEDPQPDTDKFRAVRIAGRVTGPAYFVLTSQRGLGPGFRVIAPFETKVGRIAVDFGFLPGKQRDPGLPMGEIDIIGNLHWPEETDGYTPEPDQKRRLIYARDLEGLAPLLGTRSLLVVARETTPEIAGLRPWPVSTRGIPNDHLEYAITWFSLALVWFGMTAYWLWRIRRRSFGSRKESV